MHLFSRRFGIAQECALRGITGMLTSESIGASLNTRYVLIRSVLRSVHNLVLASLALFFGVLKYEFQYEFSFSLFLIEVC